MKHESDLAQSPLSQGPIANLLQRIAYFQRMERRKKESEPNYSQILKTSIVTASIVTARNAPAHERVVTTLKAMNVDVDEVFFMGGYVKKML